MSWMRWNCSVTLSDFRIPDAWLFTKRNGGT